MKAMILAAGFGTRLRPVTSVFAKPAVPFLNVPLLYYSMALLASAGIEDFVINSHYLPEQIERLAKTVTGLAKSTIVKHEAGAPLGSGGGIWNARAELKDSDFWIANGDEVILPRQADIFQRIQRQHQESKAIATIVVMEHPGVGTQFGGVWATANGDVKGFGKSAHEFPETSGYHYIGLQLMSPRVFDYLPEGESNILYDALKSAIAAGEKVQISIGDFTWFETGNPHDFLTASKECLELLTHSSRANGSDRDFLIDALKRSAGVCPRNLSHTSSAIVLVAASARIESSVQFEGTVTVGAEVKIGAGAVIANSALLDGAIIRAGARIENQIVIPHAN